MSQDEASGVELAELEDVGGELGHRARRALDRAEAKLEQLKGRVEREESEEARLQQEVRDLLHARDALRSQVTSLEKTKLEASSSGDQPGPPNVEASCKELMFCDDPPADNFQPSWIGKYANQRDTPACITCVEGSYEECLHGKTPSQWCNDNRDKCSTTCCASGNILDFCDYPPKDNWNPHWKSGRQNTDACVACIFDDEEGCRHGMTPMEWCSDQETKCHCGRTCCAMLNRRPLQVCDVPPPDAWTPAWKTGETDSNACGICMQENRNNCRKGRSPEDWCQTPWAIDHCATTCCTMVAASADVDQK